MKRNFLLASAAAMGLAGNAFAASDPAPSMGIVNFATCITDSKVGKHEQASFEALKKQMATLLEDTEKQMTEISNKFSDSEYLDGLSPEAEEEMKAKYRALNEELARYQNQYYQVLNQANMKLIQVMSSNINTAAEKVAKDKKLTMIVNKDACFFYNPQLEITSAVIAEMDRTFKPEENKAPAAQPTPAAAPAAATAPVENDSKAATAQAAPAEKSSKAADSKAAPAKSESKVADNKPADNKAAPAKNEGKAK